jgi:hypothetical protein
MPIRLEYRKYYDVRWRKFRLTALEAAGNVWALFGINTVRFWRPRWCEGRFAHRTGTSYWMVRRSSLASFCHFAQSL